ncbi:MAG: Cu(I)/Ag(I) efflux system membrane fusion protein, partial [Myxococcota bacterium]
MKPALKQLLTSTLPVLAALAVGCGVGFWMADAPDQPAAPVAEDGEPHAGHAHGAPPPAAEASDATTYTCSMHPSVRSDTPGQCPLCGMDLVPTSTNAGQAGRVMMSEEARILAAIETVEVVQGPAIRTVRLVGQVAPADTGIDAVTAWFRGRIERLYVDFVGAEVTKGDKLYSIFSPELLTAQRELLATAARKTKVASLPGSVLTEAAEHAHTAARER